MSFYFESKGYRDIALPAAYEDDYDPQAAKAVEARINAQRLTPQQLADGGTVFKPEHDCYVEECPAQQPGGEIVYYPDLPPVFIEPDEGSS